MCVCVFLVTSTYQGKCDGLNQEEERREPGTTLYLIGIEWVEMQDLVI